MRSIAIEGNVLPHRLLEFAAGKLMVTIPGELGVPAAAVMASACWQRVSHCSRLSAMPFLPASRTLITTLGATYFHYMTASQQ